MKYIFVAAAVLSTILLSPAAYGFGGCEEDCAKCHSLDQNEAEQILSRMKAVDSKVVGIKMSPVRGLWEISVDKRGKSDVVYVGFSKKHVVQGAIIDLDSGPGGPEKAPVRKPAVNAPKGKARYIDPSKIPLDGSLVLGDRGAEHKVVVFTDPDCPYCARIHAELRKVVQEKNDIAFFLKLMPLKIHPDSYWKSQSIICSGSMQLLEENFEKKPVPKPMCETKVIDANLDLGAELGITGTPTLIMPDGFVLFGGLDAKGLRDLVISHPAKRL